ncbi:cytochrome c [soil metagenome]
MKRLLLVLVALIVLIPLAIIGFEQWNEPEDSRANPPAENPAAQISRGAYLARAGDCRACHTTRGGMAYAGGRAIPTPYGEIFAPNITPEPTTGLGTWTPDDFWRALHHGKSKDGRFLYPAFPFPNYTKMTRADADALFAYLLTVAPVKQANREHALRFPYNQRVLLAGWRALYFRPGTYQPTPQKSLAWNRGAYLVQGLGHCNACHTNRTMFGGQTSEDLAGGLIPMMNWYAPSLNSDAEAGLGNWEERQIVDLLKTGVSEKGAVFGPMAEVVAASLQHLSDDDVSAMAAYLKSLPQTAAPSPQGVPASAEGEGAMKLGTQLYEKHCVGCHQENGQGNPPAYPPLAANRALTMHSPVNPIRMILNGGFPPSTGGNPRPYGMPPYGHALNDVEVAALATYIRNSWGNRAPLISPGEVNRYRGTPQD